MKIQHSLKNRFLLTFVIGAFLVCLIAFTGIFGMMSGHSAYENLVAEQEALSWFINHLKEDIRDTRIEMLTMYSEKEIAQRPQYKGKIEALDKNIDVDLELMINSDLLTNKDILREKLMDIKSEWGAFKDIRYARVVPLLIAGKDEEARGLLSGVQKESYISMGIRLEEAYSLTEKILNDKHHAIDQRNDGVIYAVLVFISIGIMSGAVFFYMNFRNILSRINMLKEGAQSISQGDLSSRVEVAGEDEIAALGAAFNHMADWIQEDMDTMLKSERELQDRNEKLNEAMVEAQQHVKIIEFAATERERQNKQLVEMQSQLVQTEKMASVGQLAAGVAHEINNPVGYVNGNISTLSAYIEDIKELNRKYSELLTACHEHRCDSVKVKGQEIRQFMEDKDMDFVFEDLSKLLAESREGLDRVTTIVRDLKHFSHVDEAELREFDINKGLDSTINVAWNEIKYKAEVNRDYGDIPHILCYPQQLNQVFMNIIVNASHAISNPSAPPLGKEGNGGMKGVIGIRTYQADNDVFVEISDNGCGIPEDKISKIFEPFFTTKPVGKGTGLGLSMAYTIIRKHKGEIDVRSKVGEGTTFMIKLPIVTDMDRAASGSEEEAGKGI